MSDFQITDQGSIFLIRPLNEAARQWLDENVVSEPWQWVEGALFVEPASPAISSSRSKRPGSRSPVDRCRTPSRCARHGAAASEQSRS